MPPDKSDHEMIAEIYQLMLGKGGCWERGAKTAREFYAFRLVIIVAGVSLFGSGFGFARLLEMVK